jgi:Glycosyltransferase family 87
LVWATGSNIELACQVFYWINMVALVALSLIVWRLSLRLIVPKARSNSSFLLILIALSLNGPAMFAVDRSQSEIVSAALCWGAVLLFLRGQHGWSMTAVTFAAAIKGYAVPVGVGLLLATRGRKQLLRGIAAATAVSLAVTVPVFQYLKHGFTAMLFRTEFSFVAIWFNHGFKNTFYEFEPKLGDPGRRWMLVLTFVIMLGALWRLMVATRKGTREEVTARVIVFAGTALALMIGLPVYSGPYNYLLVLPALILASTRYADFVELLKLHTPVAAVLGVVLAVALTLALMMRWLGHDLVTTPGIALVLFVGCLATLVIARPSPAT